jgi:hypothetical protein
MYKNVNLLSLPDEIILTIYFFLDSKSIWQISESNKKLFELAENECLWKDKLLNDFNVMDFNFYVKVAPIVINQAKQMYKLIANNRKPQVFWEVMIHYLSQIYDVFGL